MKVEVVARYLSTLPDDDDHPYRTGPWRPNHVEYDATDLEVTGELPVDLNGVYLRNTENPLHQSIGRYHPFDGDGMVHALHFRAGRADYRNRFVRTVGFDAETAAGASLWAGLAESPEKSIREDGWGARGRMKDASSTDIVVHGGKAITSFYQCGDLYELDPVTLHQHGRATWGGNFPSDVGVSAHTKVDEATGELLFFNYSTTAPYLHYGVVDAANELIHYVDVELPGPRLPHDMAFTEHYAILNDCPLFWDADLLARGVHAARFHPELPTRFAIVPRRGAGEARWFEAEPTYVLHWINAYEDGDEVVLDGYFQGDPAPADRGEGGFYESLSRFLSLDRMRPRPHRWRFDLRTGQTKEEDLSDQILEFGTINARHGGRAYRYVYNVTGVPGHFLFDGLVKLDLETGNEDRYAFAPGVFGSEAPMAPSPSGTAEDDGYLVTFTTDMNDDRSQCLVFDASDLASGPVARVALPERISSGTHACWASTPTA